jgi:hypothetical protein
MRDVSIRSFPPATWKGAQPPARAEMKKKRSNEGTCGPKPDLGRHQKLPWRGALLGLGSPVQLCSFLSSLFKSLLPLLGPSPSSFFISFVFSPGIIAAIPAGVSAPRTLISAPAGLHLLFRLFLYVAGARLYNLDTVASSTTSQCPSILVQPNCIPYPRHLVSAAMSRCALHCQALVYIYINEPTRSSPSSPKFRSFLWGSLRLASLPSFWP